MAEMAMNQLETAVISTGDDEDEKVTLPFLFSFFKNMGSAEQICLQDSIPALGFATAGDQKHFFFFSKSRR